MTLSPRLRDFVPGASAAAAALVLYTATLQPDFGGPEDTPKFQFIGYVLGVPHPPGYPLYVLLTRAFVSLPVGTIAYRANLFSALMGAVACALAYAIGRQIGARRWTSFCAALAMATGASVWRSAVFAEVYSLAAVMAGLSIALLLAWGARGGTRRLVASFGAFAFGLGNHLTIVGVVPAFAAYVLTRRRPVWSLRMAAASALLLVLGVGQYALITLRSRQNAPYLEVRADTLPDLVRVITAERYAGQRFAFSPAVLLTDHLPGLTSLIAREFGNGATLLFVVGAITGLRRANVALVLGAAAGMFVMVLNISGDLRGFITPLMVLLWPCVALGVDRVANYAGTTRLGSRATPVLVAAAAFLPAINIGANYRDADRRAHTGDAAFVRAALAQLPEQAGFINEDYWSDMALHYFTFTGEAGRDLRIARIDFDAAAVRRAAAEGRRVFGLGRAATYLAAEGLRFRRAAVHGPPLHEWLAQLPRGSVVAGATAYAPDPPDPAALGHPRLRPPGRFQSFEVFAAVAGRQGGVWRKADDEASIHVDAGSLAAPLPAFGGTVIVSADRSGARVDVGGRLIATATRGLVLAVFAPDGTLHRALEFPAGTPRQVPYAGALYEAVGEVPCAVLTSEHWTEMGPVLAGGSWVATMQAIGSVVLELRTPGARAMRTRSALLLGDGSIRTSAGPGAEGDLLTTELTRSGENRAVFRLALDRPLPEARARLRAGGAQSSVRVCASTPVQPLLDKDGAIGTLKADFESEPHFGAGWSDAERTPTGPVRRGRHGATLFLPLPHAGAYRVSLDVTAANAVALEVMVNGIHVATCGVPAGGPCEVILPADAVRAGVNALVLSDTGGAPAEGALFTFRGARLERISGDAR